MVLALLHAKLYILCFAFFFLNCFWGWGRDVGHFKSLCWLCYSTVSFLCFGIFFFFFFAVRHMGSQFPDQGSNPHPLHLKATSSPLDHQGSPCLFSLLKDFVHSRCQDPQVLLKHTCSAILEQSQLTARGIGGENAHTYWAHPGNVSSLAPHNTWGRDYLYRW